MILSEKFTTCHRPKPDQARRIETADTDKGRSAVDCMHTAAAAAVAEDVDDGRLVLGEGGYSRFQDHVGSYVTEVYA